jgi:signal transduction histidine kinase
MTCTPGTFTLSDLVSNISLIRNMAEQKGITLNVSVPANALVTCDSNMIATVVRNLLTNAVKFTATGGTVTLKASPNPLPSASPAGFKGGEFPPPSGELEGAFISVSDTGIGMSSEQIRNLYHLDNSQTRRGTAGEKGAGLGLIVCRELLEKHGATLHVESEEGKGSRFWFELK